MRLGGIVIVTALLLGACSSDPAPIEPPPTAASTTPTPTRPVPSMPPQASEDSPAGAAAFVSHYVDVLNHAAATGDVDELSHLSDPGCTGCQKYIDLYRDTYAAGGYFRGGDWKIGDLRVRSGRPESFLTTDITTLPSTYRETRSDAVKRDPGDTSTISFAVSRTSVGWRATQFGLGAVE